MTEDAQFEDDLQDDPDVEDVSETTMMCWKETTRVCGGDCVAFDERSMRDPRFSLCIVLNSERQQAVSLAGIKSQLQRQCDFAEKESAIIIQEAVDAKRLRVEYDKRCEAEARAQKIKDLDRPPPEVNPT